MATVAAGLASLEAVEVAESGRPLDLDFRPLEGWAGPRASAAATAAAAAAQLEDSLPAPASSLSSSW